MSTRPGWGFLVTSVTRYGVTHRRLVVLAPGSTRRDLRMVRLHQESPWIALLLAAPVLLLAQAVGAVDASIAAAGTACAVAGLCARISRRARRGAVRLDACSGNDLPALPSLAAERVLLGTAALLRSAEREVRAARMSPVRFERVWQEAYASAAPFDARRRPRPGAPLGSGHERRRDALRGARRQHHRRHEMNGTR